MSKLQNYHSTKTHIYPYFAISNIWYDCLYELLRHIPTIINRIMTTDTTKLEKIIKEQTKQIDSLKKAVAGLQRQLLTLSKKTNRAYENSRKNANDINNITRTIGRNG